MRAAGIVLLLITFQAQGQTPSKPQIAAFFSRIDDGPAFFVECRNGGGAKLSSSAGLWAGMGAGSLRVDGVLLPQQASMGPGLSTDVEPGQPWRGIIVLRQSETSYFPAVKFGALKRITQIYPIQEGRHVIAVQCEGIWSDDFAFYWENERTHSIPSDKPR